MKKALVFLVLFLVCLLPAALFAQSAKIIDIKGEVSVKSTAVMGWQKAKMNMLLNQDAEVKTQNKSECTLAFDAGLKNIVTIKENSQIKIDSVRPGNIFLSEGRVFSLIKRIDKAETFQVRTPTAIAGARGTGWLTIYKNKKTSILCFDEKVYAQCINNISDTGKRDVLRGWGIDVSEGCAFGNIYQLQSSDYKEWDNFAYGAAGAAGEGSEPDEGLQESQDEQRQGPEDARDEMRREEEEERGREPYDPGQGYEPGGR